MIPLPEIPQGVYRAQVVAVNDPTQRGRITVRVYPWFDKIPDAALPWAEMVAPTLGGSTEDSGVIAVPPVGSWVAVFFEVNDPLQPVYFGCYHGISGGTPTPPALSRTSGEYPRNSVMKVGGHTIEIDTTSGAERIEITHSDGLKLKIEDGQISIGNVDSIRKLINDLLAENVTAGGVGLNEHYHEYKDLSDAGDTSRLTGGPYAGAAIPVPGALGPPVDSPMDASTAETTETKAS